MGFLLILDYQSDAERKRIDYAIERWAEATQIRKPKGSVLLFEGENLEEFLEDLFSRLETGRERVKVYSLSEYVPEIGKKVQKLSYESKEPIEFIQKFLNYLMSKINASYDYSSGPIKSFTAYTKKGQVKINTKLERDIKTKVVIKIEGYGEAVDFIAKKMDDEMRVFLGEV